MDAKLALGLLCVAGCAWYAWLIFRGHYIDR
jgi:hypothetical protein